jgi:hyperosmotically inducible protein
VKYALIINPDIPARSLNVETHKGVVQISGYLRSLDEKMAALQTAREVKNVERVEDAIYVDEGPRTFGSFIDDEAIQAGLKAKLVELGGPGAVIEIITHVRNGEVILAGFVSSKELADKMMAAARQTTNVTKVHNRLRMKS